MESIEISRIRLDGGTQPRGSLSLDCIQTYAEDMRAGVTFPPVDLCYDGQDYWLWDGFHRVNAARVAGHDKIDANVAAGTKADAQWLSYSANKAHGLYRSNEDKRRAVLAALGHPKAVGLSNMQIAEHCGVSEFLVRTHRRKSTSIESKSSRRKGRDGRTIKTAKIGKRKPKQTRKRKYGGIAKDAYTPVLGHSNPPPMVPLSLPKQNPEIAANTLIELFDTAWLAALVARIARHLQSKDPQEPKGDRE